MPFRRYVEIGRVAVVNYGPEAGKLVVIVDVVDRNRALVDRPDEIRHIENFKRLTLTDFKVEIPRAPKKKVLGEAIKESGAFEKFAASGWGQKLAQQRAKAAMTDLDRFKAMVQRKKKAATVRKALKAQGL